MEKKKLVLTLIILSCSSKFIFSCFCFTSSLKGCLNMILMIQIYQINVRLIYKIFLDDGDAENSPKLSFKAYINNSLVCLDDLKDAIACKLDMYFIYERLNIKSIKEELLNQRLSEDNVYENSIQCYQLRFNIAQCNPYFCKFEDLDGSKDFMKINKRELIKPFAL